MQLLGVNLKELKESSPKKKGLGDELEELQVEIMKDVSEAEENKKKKKSSSKTNKSKRPKKLTKEGKKWVKAAEKDMAERTKSK